METTPVENAESETTSKRRHGQTGGIVVEPTDDEFRRGARHPDSDENINVQWLLMERDIDLILTRVERGPPFVQFASEPTCGCARVRGSGGLGRIVGTGDLRAVICPCGVNRSLSAVPTSRGISRLVQHATLRIRLLGLASCATSRWIDSRDRARRRPDRTGSGTPDCVP